MGKSEGGAFPQVTDPTCASNRETKEEARVAARLSVLMNQIVPTQLQLQRLWEEARITRNVTLMVRTMWLALAKPSKGLFISREANCVWKRME